MNPAAQKFRGRGAASNPTNRFATQSLERFEDYDPGEDPSPRTQFIADASASLINYNDSPDIPFTASINVYRGCEHGCAYCYARPTHEYLGFSPGLDFETKIVVKYNAPELLRNELSSPKWKPQCLAMSGVTDCYQPAERKLQLTRRVLEVLLEFRNPVGIVTKNHLVTRDVDLLAELAKFNAAIVYLSITTLDPELTTKLEPRSSLPKMRLAAIKTLREAGVPVGVLLAPMIPGLNDHEMPKIIEAAAEAGAQSAGLVPLRLPFAVKDIFSDWLTRHFPDRKENVLNRIRSLRGGKLNQADFGARMHGQGIWAEQLQQMFQVAARRAGLNQRDQNLSTEHFRRPGGTQLLLFSANAS
ncbi:MAG: PA0069 family radical SAM protein [Verrucomicrobia bacterium]|nr:MAG: PA0069 family radical SAM protein [Verrucomicrobiota bacterium]